MTASYDKRFEILNDHYRETCSYLATYRKQRDRFFLYLLIVLGIMFLQMSSPDKSYALISGLLSKSVRESIHLDQSFIRGLVWFFLLSLVLKYFQIVVLIERQYAYVHKLENELTIHFSSDIPFTREGKSYLKHYPKLSDWADILYVWFFPAMLLFFVSAKIVIEFPTDGKPDLVWGISFLMCLMIWVTSILYLLFRINLKKAQQQQMEDRKTDSQKSPREN